MKKIISILSACLFVFALSSCGGSSNQESCNSGENGSESLCPHTGEKCLDNHSCCAKKSCTDDCTKDCCAKKSCADDCTKDCCAKKSCADDCTKDCCA